MTNSSPPAISLILFERSRWLTYNSGVPQASLGYARKKNQDFLFDAEVMFIRKYLLGQN